MNLAEDLTLTQTLPTVKMQIERLQRDRKRPHSLVSLDIGFLLMTANLKYHDTTEWLDFLGTLGMTPEIGDAYMNFSGAYLELEAACRLQID